MRLAEDRFYQQYPCIIVTGKGQPDLSTRLFLKLITTKLKIPILGLFDSDPYGLKVTSFLHLRRPFSLSPSPPLTKQNG